MTAPILDGARATYSPEDNKLRLYPDARLEPEIYARVKAEGFIWAPQQKLFVAPTWTPSREDLLVELCGEVGDEDTSLVDRAEVRAERFEGYSENRLEDAEAARDAVASIASGIPLGQPILVGHHSERRARRDAEKIERGMEKAVRMWDCSRYWASRAKGALHHAKYKERPDVRARRIKGLEAERRKHARNIESAEAMQIGWANTLRIIDERGPEKGLEHAIYLAGRCALRTYETYNALQDGELSAEDAACKGLMHSEAVIAYAQRWISHLDNRLTYERALLADAGASHLLKPKPRATHPPICNYKAKTITVPNRYNRGENMVLTQVNMTAAEYAAINKDYKGTHVCENSHRVRVAMVNGSRFGMTGGTQLVAVFLTDSKTHAKPEPALPKVDPPPTMRMPVERSAMQPDPAAEEFSAMRESLKSGVQVVSAPQLFPTPAELADRMVELADIRPGQCVLEPSAGTGAIIDAIRRKPNHGCAITAVEINPELAKRLRTVDCVETVCADFLTCNGDLGLFERVLMNPPFENGADIRHIQHARTLLTPGGRLVAICANGPRQREKLMPEAEDWIDLPTGSFATSGTMVNAAVVIFTGESES